TADTTRSAVLSLNAVARTQTTEIVPLHDTRRTAPLRGANHIHMGHLGEQTDRHLLTDVNGHLFTVCPKLPHEPGRFAVRLRQQRHATRGTPPLTLAADLGNMTALRPTGETPRLLLEAELNRLVAIAIEGPQLQNRARPGLDHSDRQNIPLVIIDLSH